MRENLLLLCMAYPEKSKTFGASVCMAGITEAGEFRRIYPVPFGTFASQSFHKKQWISYEIKEKGDTRKESYKIIPESMLKGDIITDTELRNICTSHRKTLEELWEDRLQDETSLGIVKPIVKRVQVKPKTVAELNKSKEAKAQLELNGIINPVDTLQYKIFYHFDCGENCRGHKCLCLDTETGQLERNLRKKYDNDEDIIPRIESHLNRINLKDLHFLLGTHSRHRGSWMIISLLYPPKQMNMTLQEFGVVI